MSMDREVEKATVLCVDDEECIRSSIGMFLKRSGYRYFAARNAREGLDIFREQKPDVILIDVIMPEMGGFDMLTQISEESPGTPVIVMSGMDDGEHEVKAMQLGAVGYLSKPLESIRILRQAIDQAVEKAKQVRGNLKKDVRRNPSWR